MIDDEEPRVGLDPLQSDARLRADRIAHQVLQRIEDQSDTVKTRLARFAIPALLAAAASLAMVFLSRPHQAEPDPFAVLVVGPGPARAWITFNRAPDLEEVRMMMGGA